MGESERVLVYGAAGHTGGFVVDELLARGVVPILAGRSAERLGALAPRHAELEVRVADVADAPALHSALRGIDVVINCAGPFLDTALPLARAAISAGSHYLDVTAEQPAVAQVYQQLDEPARAAGVVIVPAMAFYGGLADLLVSWALDGDTRADDIQIAIGLDHWWPTIGTRVTGERNTATRQVVRGGQLVPLIEPVTTTWTFAAPLGEQAVIELPFSEVMTIARHIEVRELNSYLNTSPLAEIRSPSTPAPTAADGRGRSSQRFEVDAVVRRGSTTETVSITGRDIYAVSAPIISEGAVRLLEGRYEGVGALAPAQAFDASDVLAALARDVDGLSIQRGHERAPSGVGQLSTDRSLL